MTREQRLRYALADLSVASDTVSSILNQPTAPGFVLQKAITDAESAVEHMKAAAEARA